MHTKICSKCSVEKDLTEFGKCKDFKDGLAFDCKVCHNLSRRVWARAHRGQERAALDKYIKKYPEFALLTQARGRAKQRGTPCTIQRTDIIIPEFCPVLGIKLEKGIGKVHDASPSLDCIKPDLGYIPGNIAVISHRANTIKSNATVDEIDKVSAWLKQQ